VTDIAIRVDNPCPERSRRPGKRYRIGGPRARYKTLRESLMGAVQAPFRRLSSVHNGSRPMTNDRRQTTVVRHP
jgi:hypothetical protein